MILSDALRALVSQAETLEAHAATLEGVTAAQAVRIQDQAAEIEHLTGLLAALTPAKPKTLIGCSVKGSTKAALDSARPTYGSLGIVRRFSPAGLSPLYLPEDGTPVALSYKDTDRVAIRDTLQAAKDRGISGFVTYFHEPEDNFPPGSVGPYFAGWDVLLEEVAALPGGTLQPLPILMSWTLNPKSGRDWRTWDPDPSLPIAFDLYRNDPALVIEWSRSTGRRFAIPEIGIRDADDVTRAAWIRDRLTTLLAAEPLFVCYFDSANGGDYPLGAFPLAAEAWREFASA